MSLSAACKGPDSRPAQRDMAVLTPYLMPDELSGRKAVNLGDGFILRAIERLVGAIPPERTLTCRSRPSEAALLELEDATGVILAGANQLHATFAPWPGLTAAGLRASRLRLIPFAVGVHGETDNSLPLSEATLELLEAIHERVEYSSWRCPLTVQLLETALPSLAGRFLMTGCPVAFDVPVLEGRRFHDGTASIAVTVTDRQSFWDREVALLDAVSELFPTARRFMVLHQDFASLSPKWLRGVPAERTPMALRDYATRRGYDVVVPGSAEAAIEFYRSTDLHIGSRVHAHLHFLSRNKRSFLTAVDDRSRGMALAYGFQLTKPESLALDLARDFEPVRERIRHCYEVTRHFLNSVARS
jgi:hypothetical protein